MRDLKKGMKIERKKPTWRTAGASTGPAKARATLLKAARPVTGASPRQHRQFPPP
jgi:hypothetical protein